MGLAWASGINLYATLLTLGFLANSGNIMLPSDLQIAVNPAVMVAAGMMYFIEFFAEARHQPAVLTPVEHQSRSNALRASSWCLIEPNIHIWYIDTNHM